MRPQSVQSVPLSVSSDHCAFAIQQIRTLNSIGEPAFGSTWPWFELLIRPHPRVFPGSPGAYIDHLYEERSPELTDIEVVKRAMHWLMTRDQPTRVSLNTHPQSLTCSEFCAAVLHAQRRANTLGHSICLELVEFGECLDRKRLTNNARLLRGHGVTMALDDFGSRINCFDLCAAGIVDVVKIDTTIVSHLHTDRFQRAIVESIAKLGTGLGAQVVAEGVESRAEARVLMDIGIDFAQGFFFHRPEIVEI